MFAPGSPLTVLVVDDEPDVRASLSEALELEGCEVLVAEDGLQGLGRLGDRHVDALVLDAGLPFVDGLETCRRIRAGGNQVPILMVDGRDDVDDRVAGLEAGADDYLVRPFAVREFVARLRAITRRRAPADDNVLEVEDLRLDRAARRVWRDDRLVDLTRTEFALLEALASRPGEVLTRTQLHLRVWNYDFGPDSNSLGVYVGYVRRKLEAGGEPRLLQTVRGVGYVLRA